MLIKSIEKPIFHKQKRQPLPGRGGKKLKLQDKKGNSFLEDLVKAVDETSLQKEKRL